MKNEEITKQMVNLFKSSFDNNFSVMVMFQEQMEGILKNFIDQSHTMNDDQKKMLYQWIGAYKKGLNDIKTAINDGYAKTENLLECIEMKNIRDQSDNVFRTLMTPKGWIPFDFNSYMGKINDTYKNIYDEFKKQIAILNGNYPFYFVNLSESGSDENKI